MDGMICLEGMYFYPKDIRFILPVSKAVDKPSRKEAKTIVYFKESSMEIFFDTTPEETIKLIREEVNKWQKQK